MPSVPFTVSGWRPKILFGLLSVRPSSQPPLPRRCTGRRLALPAELNQSMDQKPGAPRTDGVTEGDRSPAHIDLVRIQSQFPTGACPKPAERTFPRITSSNTAAPRPARCSACAIAMLPNRVAGTELSPPLKLPIGVRTALTMTASLISPPLQNPRAAIPRLPTSSGERNRSNARPETRVHSG